MAKIRHVVYRAADLEAMANFFVDAFGMTVVRRRPEGGIDLSDGTIHLAVLPVRTEAQRLGIEHIGFAVEDEPSASGLLPGVKRTLLKGKQTFPDYRP